MKILSSKIKSARYTKRIDAEGKFYAPNSRYENNRSYTVANFSSAERDYEVWFSPVEALLFAEWVIAKHLEASIKTAIAADSLTGASNG